MAHKANLQILSAYVDPEPEVDSDITQYEYTAVNMLKYDLLEFYDAIGKEEFKEVYRNFITDIRLRPFDAQQALCEKIIKRILEIYDFEFPERVELENQYHFEEVYKLVKFIEFDNIDFIGDVWKYLKVDPRRVNIEQYCYDKDTELVEAITNQIETYDSEQLFAIFLRTYIKDKLIEWFIEVSEKNKSLVSLRMIEGEIDG